MRIRFFILTFSMLIIKVSSASAAGPSFVYPQHGQSLVHKGGYMFKVNPVPGATRYLWGFFQNGEMVWENFRDEGRLHSNEYGIFPRTRGHQSFLTGNMDVMVRAIVNNRWTDATTITIELTPVVELPVLMMTYLPPDPNNPDYLDPTETGWHHQTVNHMKQAANDMADTALPVLSDATRYRGTGPRYLEYTILERKVYYQKMPRGHTLSAGAHRPNYGKIMKNHNICHYVDHLGVKEVWIYGYHSQSIVPDESKLSSAYGDISNALPKDESIREEFRLPACENSYTLYNFTYQPGGSNAYGNTVHNRLHQIENVIFYAEDKGYPVNPTRARNSVFWDDFSVYGNLAAEPGYLASCGNTHLAPNGNHSVDEYKYTLTQYKLSNCDTWHPDDSQTTYDMINCSRWGCTDIGFYTWFMQNIPGHENNIVYQGKQMRNWWIAMYDFNRFIRQGGRSLYQ